jgi:hypothetical protein
MCRHSDPQVSRHTWAGLQEAVQSTRSTRCRQHIPFPPLIGHLAIASSSNELHPSECDEARIRHVIVVTVTHGGHMEATWSLTSNGDAGTFDCAPTTIVSASRGGIASVVDSTCTCRHKLHCRLMRCLLNFQGQASIPPQVRCSTFLNCAASSDMVYRGTVSCCSLLWHTPMSFPK